MNTMSAKIHPHLMIHSAVILLYLIKSLKSATEEEKLPTNTPSTAMGESYKRKLLYFINELRKYHKLPKLENNKALSLWSDIMAEEILKKKGRYSSIYVPGEMEENPPDDYFPLVNRMSVPNITEYVATCSRYNPISMWWLSRKNYPGHYDKNLHPKYGGYTQLIWKNSEKVGIGLAYQKLHSRSYEVVLFLTFSPRGNNPDTWDANVRLPNSTNGQKVDLANQLYKFL